MKRVLGLFVLLFLCLQSTAQQTINASVMVDGVQRDYILYIPASYSSSTSVPLLFNFHGYQQSATYQMSYGDFRKIADTAGFILVHPEGALHNTFQHWNVGGWTAGSTAKDVSFTETLIDSLSAKYSIDAKRIYSTGYSNGGYFSIKLACELSNKIAAVASVAGSMSTQMSGNCTPTRPVPIMQIHGTNDALVPYSGGPWAMHDDTLIKYWVNLNNCKSTPVTTPLPDIDKTDGSTVVHRLYRDGDKGSTFEHYKVQDGDHDWPGNTGNMDMDASKEIWRFFLQYTLDGAVVSIAEVQDMVTGVSISPSPTTHVAKLLFSAANDGQTRLVITDILGKVVLQKEIRYKVGNNAIHLDVSDFVGGMYIVSIQSEQIKLMVE